MNGIRSNICSCNRTCDRNIRAPPLQEIFSPVNTSNHLRRELGRLVSSVAKYVPTGWYQVPFANVSAPFENRPNSLLSNPCVMRSVLVTRLDSVLEDDDDIPLDNSWEMF